MEQEEKLYNEMKNLREFTYLGDTVSTGGGDSGVIVRKRLEWLMFRECDELPSGNRFSVKVKWTDYKGCVRSSILYGSVVW